MPDWSRLSSYHDKKWKNFEELCYQVTHRLYSSKGTLSRIDDSGGGDGVEFYLTFPNGTEWGWQAKYYPPGSRLSEKNRKTHIADSFKRSLRNHPKLKKWFLCTPMTFTTEEPITEPTGERREPERAGADGNGRARSGFRLVRPCAC